MRLGAREIRVQTFAVPKLEISDHLPLILEFYMTETEKPHRAHADTSQSELVA